LITGGDHVMDLLKATHIRADDQFRCLKEAMKPLEMPIHGVVGNHDVFGWGTKDIDRTDPEYGKKMLEDRFLHSVAYRSFDFNGWHFVLLDGVQPEPKIGWHGMLDQTQLDWLDRDLASAGTRPKIIISHFPAMTLFPQYTDGATSAATDTLVLSNGKDLQQLCFKHGVKAVLQGHTHVVEDCHYLGTRYITGGAVCGDWWKGWRLGVHPEGFLVIDLSPTDLKTTYVSYGWDAKSHLT
jgi:3',5'-cyclic AMP phosphodiesterase CpdA